MLYQTGYLTIESYSHRLYELRVPDEEVRQDLAALVAEAYAGKDAQVEDAFSGERLVERDRPGVGVERNSAPVGVDAEDPVARVVGAA